jgi:uncharacterized membrane protein (DUF4010 family)
MDWTSTLEPWWRFAAALFIGALIGLEREFVQQRTEDPEFAGIRTFSLIALLGAIAAHLSLRFGLWPFIAVYLGLALLVWASYLGSIYREEGEGITTEVVALLVPLLGAMVVWDEFELAAALAVVVALWLALKPRLHDLARKMSTADLRATLEFLLITIVVLPILPDRSFGPYEVVNPFQIWLLVVLVSGIGFFGYVLMKVFGTEQGIGITGVLGGLVSSTATTVSFASRSKLSPSLWSLLLRGILLSSSIMFPRILVEVSVVYPPLLAMVSPVIAVMFLVSLGAVLFLWRRDHTLEEPDREQVELTNPLRIQTAVGFALVFTLVLVAVRAANEFFGSAGVYLASAVTGIADVDAITLSASELASLGQIEPGVAAMSVVLAALVNTASKAVLALSLGAREMRRGLMVAYGLILLLGLISSGLVLFFVA